MVKARTKKAAVRRAVRRVISRQPRKTNLRNRSVRNKRRRAVAPTGRAKQTFLGKALRAGGRYIGGLAGFPSMGEAAGAAISRIVGQGDYKIQSNTLFPASQNQTSGPVPQFVGQYGAVFSHAEYLGDIYSGPLASGASQFTTATYPINPGVVSTFPWLSQIANDFEKYELLGCCFEFRSMSGDAIASTNASLGTVIMSTQYNISNPPFASKVTQENFQYCTSGKPSCNLIHPVECAPALTVEPRKYVRLPSQTATHLTDWGNFQISTQGVQAAGVNLGELWVTYHIRFWDSRLLPTLSQTNLPQAYSAFQYKSVSNTFSSTAPLGTAPIQLYPGNSSLINVVSPYNLINFDSSLVGRTYLVALMAMDSSAAADQAGYGLTLVPQGAGDVVTFKNWFQNPAGGRTNNFTTIAMPPSTPAYLMSAVMLTLTSTPNTVLQLKMSTSTTYSPTCAQLMILEVPSSYANILSYRKVEQLIDRSYMNISLDNLKQLFYSELPRETPPSEIIRSEYEELLDFIDNDYDGDLVKMLKDTALNMSEITSAPLSDCQNIILNAWSDKKYHVLLQFIGQQSSEGSLLSSSI